MDESQEIKISLKEYLELKEKEKHVGEISLKDVYEYVNGGQSHISSGITWSILPEVGKTTSTTTSLCSRISTLIERNSCMRRGIIDLLKKQENMSWFQFRAWKKKVQDAGGAENYFKSEIYVVEDTDDDDEKEPPPSPTIPKTTPETPPYEVPDDPI